MSQKSNKILTLGLRGSWASGWEPGLLLFPCVPTAGAGPQWCAAGDPPREVLRGHVNSGCRHSHRAGAGSGLVHAGPPASLAVGAQDSGWLIMPE